MTAIRAVQKRFSAARVAEDALARETSGDPVADLIVAGATGLVRQNLGSDVTYQELVASGQLALLLEAARHGVVAYSGQLGRLWDGLRDISPINERVAELTGTYPIDLLAHGRSLTEVDRKRLSEALENDPGLTSDLRRLHGELVFAERRFDEILEAALLLVDLLEHQDSIH